MASLGNVLSQYIGNPLQRTLGPHLNDMPSRFQSLSPTNQYSVLTTFVTSTLTFTGSLGAALKCASWKGRSACLGVAALSASIAIMEFLMIKSLAIVSSAATECVCPLDQGTAD